MSFNFEDYPIVNKKLNNSTFRFEDYPVRGQKNLQTAIQQNQKPQQDTPESVRREHPFTYDIGEWLAKHPKVSKGNKYVRGVEGLAADVKPFEKFIEQDIALPQLIGGGIEGYMNSRFLSPANLATSGASELSGKNMRLPMMNLEPHYKPEMKGSITHHAGNAVGSLIGGIGAYRDLGRVPGLAPGQGGLAQQIASSLFKGGSAGYMTGASKEGEGEFSDIGRIISALTGVGTAAGGQTARAAQNLSSSHIANDIMTRRAHVTNEVGGQIQNSFTQSAEHGVHSPFTPNQYNRHDIVPRNTKIPRDDRTRILRNTSENQTNALRHYLREGIPTMEDLHWAKVDINRKIDLLENTPRKTGRELNSGENATLRALQRTRDRMQNQLTRGFDRTGNPEIGQNYRQGMHRWNTEVRPYDVEPILQYATTKNGRRGLRESTMVKRLDKNEDFAQDLARHHPGVGSQRLAKELSLWGASSLLAGLPVAGSKYWLAKSLSDRILE